MTQREWRNERMVPLKSPGPRTDGQRDADRILYCTEFRRLGGVTQVIAVNEPTLVHTRLTHSLKVAQIGQRLAQKLLGESDEERITAGYGLDPDVVYAACLAHDLGHPPFGHVAENELQLVLRGLPAYSPDLGPEPAKSVALVDTFEGNAQTFRILTKLAWREDGEPALNLTRATLNAVLKYPWACGQGPDGEASHKWSVYESETSGGNTSSPYHFARDTLPPNRRTLEAQIMDWADDIAYAVHDVEDFFRAGLVPIDQIARDGEESKRFVTRAAHRVSGDAEFAMEAFEKLRGDHLVRSPYRGTKGDQVAVTQMSSFLINRYVSAARVDSNGDLDVSKHQRAEVDLLKQLTWVYTIDNPSLGSLQQGQRRIIRDLFEQLQRWVRKVDKMAQGREQLPIRLWDLLETTRVDPGARDAYSEDGLRDRAIVDYIAGLSEMQAIDLHQRLTGSRSDGSALQTWLTTG